MTIEEKIKSIVERFAKYESWEDRYKELIAIGKTLEPMDEQFKTEDFRIKGCQSQVWLYPKLDGGKVFFAADSDAMLVKGIIGLLVQVYSGEAPGDIIKNQPDFLKDIGISDHLSMNRTNGLASMVKQLNMYTLAFSTQV